MSMRTRTLSRSLFTLTAAAVPVAAMAPAATAAPTTPQVPSAPLGNLPTTPPSPSMTPPTAETTQVLNVAVGNVRSGAGLGYNVVGTKTQGTKVTGTWENGWLKIAPGQYISSTILTSRTASGGSSSGGSSAEQVTQYLSVPIGNVRSGAGLGYSVVGTKTQGTKVTGTWSNGWLKIASGHYISSTILTSSAPSGGSSSGGSSAEQVTQYLSVPVGNVRSGAGLGYSVVGTKTQGTKVTGTWSNGWLKIASGQYLSETILTSQAPTADRDDPRTDPPPSDGSGTRAGLMSTAKGLVGSPYVLYGTPPQAFDCSSFTWWVFQQNGIDIPRTVASQRGAVTPVTNPQPGDLVFYNNFYHVGIYAGNGMIIEAMNPSTGVIYHKMWDNDVWYGRVNGL